MSTSVLSNILLFGLLAALLLAAQAFLTPKMLRLGFVPGQDQSARIFQDKNIQALVEEMQALGFKLLGVLSEQAPLSQPIPSITLAWPEQKAFASITHIGGKAHFFFYTPYQGGQILLSANGYFGNIQARGCVVQSMPRAGMAQVWQAHLKRQQNFLEQGYLPLAEYTPETRQQAARRFYAHPAVMLWMSAYQVKSCLAGIGLLGLFAAILGAGVFLWTQKASPPPPTMTPQPAVIHAGFWLGDPKVYHCGGKTGDTWVSFEIINLGTTPLQGANVLIEDKQRGLVLYGEAPGVGILLPGFQTGEEQCGPGKNPELPRYFAAYLARKLNLQGCTPDCSPEATIVMCANPADPHTCMKIKVGFSITPEK